MGETIWTTSHAGDLGRPRSMELEDDPTAVLLHDGIPDRVRIPANSPLHPGEERMVVDHRIGPCPRPDCPHPVFHLQLDGPGDIFVAACQEHHWMTYQWVETSSD